MVTIVTQSQRFEQRLASASDAFNLKGKLLLAFSTSTTPAVVLNLNPANLGARAASLATIFSRFRINRLIFKATFVNNTTALSTTGVVGVLDDATTTEGDAPISASSVLELRCSGSYLQSQTVPLELSWQPVDKSKWYYTQNGVSGSDARLVEMGVAYAASPATGVVVSLEIDYDVTFKGATDTSAA
jgi:hypothetical protein